MTKKTTQPQPDPVTLPLWRLAEAVQARRMERNDRGGHYTYYECQLCLGKSLLTTGEIQHKPDCPIERMKKGG